MRRAIAAVFVFGFFAPLAFGDKALAAGRPWDQVRRPSLSKARDLVRSADGARLPADTRFGSGALGLKLNGRCAVMIEVAGGVELGNADLLQLYGDCLFEAGVQYHSEAKKQLLRALNQAPAAPWAGAAWRSVALIAGRKGDHALESLAYDRALAEAWRPHVRGTLFLNRAESRVNAGRLNAAVRDYRAALAESIEPDTRALAQWGLAVALDRALDAPKAMELARLASGVRFGRGGRLDALELPGVFFVPRYEVHYYRALALESKALAGASATQRVEWLQAAQLMWLSYIQAAEDGQWVPRAKQHLRDVKARLDQLPPPVSQSP